MEEKCNCTSNPGVPESIRIEHAAIKFAEKDYGLMPYNGSMYDMVVKAFKAGVEWQKNENTWISVDRNLPPYGQIVAVTSFELGKRGPLWLSYRSESKTKVKDGNDFVLFNRKDVVTHYMTFLDKLHKPEYL